MQILAISPIYPASLSSAASLSSGKSLSPSVFPSVSPSISRNPLLSTIKSIYKSEGLYGFFKGGLPSLLKAGPNVMIIYVVNERANDYFRRRKRQKEEERLVFS
jgi:hypothetical protein